MSTGKTCDECKQQLLDQSLAAPPWTSAKMLLSMANLTPTRATILSDLAVDEVAVAGYARQTLGAWGAATISGGIATSVGSSVTFTNSSGADTGVIYCWGVVSGDTTRLIQAGRFSTPFVLSSGGGTFPTTPTVNLDGLPH